MLANVDYQLQIFVLGKWSELGRLKRNTTLGEFMFSVIVFMMNTFAIQDAAPDYLGLVLTE